MQMNPSPEAVAQAFFDALERGEWHRAAEFMHPETIAAFRGEAMMLADRWAREPTQVTVEDLLRGSPDMPLEVAQYNVRKAAEYAAHDGPALSGFLANVRDASELPGLSDTELYARHIEASDPRYQVRSAYARAGRTMPPEARDGHAAAIRRTAIGVVMEGSGTAHVVFRPAWTDRDITTPPGPVDVLTLEWAGEDGWRAREFDFSGHGRGGSVCYWVSDEDEEMDS